MINSMEAALIKKDIKGITSNRQIFLSLLIVPLVLVVVIPSIFILIMYFVPDQGADFEKLVAMLPLEMQIEDLNWLVLSMIINNMMPIFFMIIPIMAASVMAASSFIGEKEKRTLETLLYAPLTLRQIFKAKVLASFVVSMLVSVFSFVVMIVVVEIEVLLTTGRVIIPGGVWLIILLLVSPAITLIAIILIVRGSAKARTMEESQQRSAFLILPIALLLVGQFAGLFLISVWLLLILGIALGSVGLILLKEAVGKMTYETILK